MKTLGKQITRNFFSSEEGRDLTIKRWKEAYASKNYQGPGAHLAYLLILGKDFRKGFRSCDPKNFDDFRWSAGRQVENNPIFKDCCLSKEDVWKLLPKSPSEEYCFEETSVA